MKSPVLNFNNHRILHDAVMVIVTTLLAFACITVCAFAEGEDEAQLTIGPGTTYDVSTITSKTVVTIDQPGEYTLKGEGNKVRFSVNPKAGDIRIYLADGLKMECNGFGAENVAPITIEEHGGTVELISKENAKIYLHGRNNAPGIAKDGYTTKLVFSTENEEKAGTIEAVAGHDAAAIGGFSKGIRDWDGCGNMTFNSGNILAKGARGGFGGGGAAIGGGASQTGRNITINGGHIIATAYDNAAAIGGGQGNSGEGIHINGGIVEAHAIKSGKTGGDGAAIGGGGGWTDEESHAVGRNISITGGNVKAISDHGGAAIGGGANCDGNTISISGGEIYAEAGQNAACIGGGGVNFRGRGLKIKISGGRIHTVCHGHAVGIGAARAFYMIETSKHGSSIEISGGTIFNRTNDSSDFAFDICGQKGTTIKITGGSIYPGKMHGGTPKDADGNTVHRVNVAVQDLKEGGLPIENLGYQKDYDYGMKDVYTMVVGLMGDDGRQYTFFPWLPDKSNHIQSAYVNSKAYCGWVSFPLTQGILRPACNVTLATDDPSNFGGGWAIVGYDALNSMKLPDTPEGYSIDYYTASDLEGNPKIMGTDGKYDANVSPYTNEDGIWIDIDTQKATFHAHMVPNKYTVKYDGNVPKDCTSALEGTMADQEMTYGVEANLSTNVYKLKGYTFGGWNTKEDGSGKAYANEEAVKNFTSKNNATVTLYAQWTPKTYTITFKSGDDRNLTKTQTVNYDQGIKLKTIDSMNWNTSGKMFHGWTAAGLGSFYQDGAHVHNLCTLHDNGDAVGMTLTANWAGAGEIKIALTLDSAGITGIPGDAFQVKLLPDGTDFNLPVTESTTMPGTYVFSGALPPGDYLLMCSGDYPVKAKFKYDELTGASVTRDFYTVKVTMDENIDSAWVAEAGRTIVPVRSLVVEGGSSITAFAEVKTGYHFDGWSVFGVKPESWNSDEARQGTVKVLGTVNLMPHAEANVYTVKFNANGGNGSMEDQDMVYNEQQGLFKSSYTRKGYTFAGWNTAEDGNGTSYQDEETVQNLTDQNRVDVILYAQWTPIVYSIQYDLDGGVIRGGAHNPRTYTAEDSFTLLEPEKEDYNFDGWTGTGCEVPKTDVHIGPDDIGDREYKANWELKKYSVTFDTNGGSKVPEQVVTIHGKVKKPENPEKKHGKFAGWYADEALTQEYDFNTEITESITLYAKWDKIPATISFDLNGGKLNGKTGTIRMESYEGDVITIPEAPTRKGYTFDYWKGSKYHPGDKYAVSGDHTMKAVWKKNGGTDPNHGSTDTGDHGDLRLWILLFIASATGMAIILLHAKLRDIFR